MQDSQLSLLFAFLNSHDLEDVGDWLVPDHYAEWTRSAAPEGLLDGDDDARRALLAELAALHPEAAVATPAELAQARVVRDGLIEMLLALDGDAAASLDRLVGELPLRMRVLPAGRIGLEPAGSGPLAVAAAALVAAHDAAVDGTWERIRLCHSESCHWAFVDRSRNGSRRWCSMGDCGARAKARAYRARQRAAE